MLELSINTVSDFFLNSKSFYFLVGFIITATLIVIAASLKFLTHNKTVIEPINCLRTLGKFNPDWLIFFAENLFKNFKYFNLGKDIYEEFICQIPKPVLNSFVARLSEKERIDWKKKMLSASEKTQEKYFIKFLQKTFLIHPNNKSHCDILLSLISLHQTDFQALIYHDDIASQSIQCILKPSFTKAFFSEMDEEKFKKSVQNIYGKDLATVKNNIKRTELLSLKNKLTYIQSTYNQNTGKNTENSFIYWLSANKEKIFYQELARNGQVNLILSLLELKIPYDLFASFPVAILSEFLTLSDERLASYFSVYSEIERRALFQKGAMEGQRRARIELQIKDNQKDQWEKMNDIKEAMNFFSDLNKKTSRSDFNFQELVKVWTSKMLCKQDKSNDIGQLRDTHI